MSVEKQIKKMTEEIMSGKIDGIQHLTALADDEVPMVRSEYVELLVRTIVYKKGRKEKEMINSFKMGVGFVLSLLVINKVLNILI